MKEIKDFASEIMNILILSCGERELRSKLLSLCKEYVPGWEDKECDN